MGNKHGKPWIEVSTTQKGLEKHRRERGERDEEQRGLLGKEKEAAAAEGISEEGKPSKTPEKTDKNAKPVGKGGGYHEV